MTEIHEAELVAKVEPKVPPLDRYVVMFWHARSSEPHWAYGINCPSLANAEMYRERDYPGEPTQIHHLSDIPSPRAKLVEAVVEAAKAFRRVLVPGHSKQFVEACDAVRAAIDALNAHDAAGGET